MVGTPSCFYRFPAQGGPPNVLVVKNGWPDEATKIFEQEQFSELAFQAYEGGAFVHRSTRSTMKGSVHFHRQGKVGKQGKCDAM